VLIYAGAAFRRPGSRFSIRIAPISMPLTKNSAADALTATKTLQRQFEAFIREAPQQWTWAHRKRELRQRILSIVARDCCVLLP
jgi:KDO2-lipid IV(A) lauroyltransferase